MKAILIATKWLMFIQLLVGWSWHCRGFQVGSQDESTKCRFHLP